MKLMIIALNTFALSPNLPAPDPTMIADQFTWFGAQLAKASAAGLKVWLLMHAPPGAIEGETAQSSNDSNNQITTAFMMWTDANLTAFMGYINSYHGMIAMTLAGHTHMDEFRLMSPGNALAITAGISPYFGNNAAYKIFKLDKVSLVPTDYSALYCDLLAPSPQFSNYYTFSQAYDLDGTLATSLFQLFPTLLASTTVQSQYRVAFFSGSSPNPIINANWPVYWCGIGYMDEAGFFNAVNTF
jgi:hypothetical protein